MINEFIRFKMPKKTRPIFPGTNKSRFRRNEQQLFRKQPRKQDDETLKSETENFEPKHATWNNLNIYIYIYFTKNCPDLETWSVVA